MSWSAPTRRSVTFDPQFSITRRSGTSRNCSGGSSGPVPRREKTSGASRPPTRGPQIAWSDQRLVRACLDGNEQAWSALIDKYKGLIYSIPIKYGASPEDAADVFQSVCLELFSQLPKLRKAAALRGSIGFIRGRCLQRLQKNLAAMGF